MKIHEIIAKKLETETLEEISEVGAIGLSVDEEATDSIQERLDVLWYRFSPSSSEELQTLVFVLKQFGVNFHTQTDDQFLDKLEIIQTFINVHGFENIFAVTSKALQKLANIYQFLEVSLATIVLEDLEKLQNFHLLVSAQSLDVLEEGKFSFIFKAFSIDSLSKWNANTVGSLNLTKCYANFAEPIPGEMKNRITSAVESLEHISAYEEHSQCEAVVLGDLTKQICDHGHFDTI